MLVVDTPYCFKQYGVNTFLSLIVRDEMVPQGRLCFRGTRFEKAWGLEC